MKLSKNFYLREFVRSQTATRKGIQNFPQPEYIENLKALCENVIQPARESLGKPIFVSSGYRSPELNEAIGGSRTSQHCEGEAADLDYSDNGKLFFEILYNVAVFDQLIWEFGDDLDPSWVHVSYKRNGDNRRQVLRAYKDKFGKTKYVQLNPEQLKI
jgi:zinc D-Ala-D-Ala carboxypeptidase